MTVPSAPGVLLVLDGWGHAPASPANAITLAHTPTLDALAAKHPTTYVEASGEAVGLLPGTVGNSEIGHMVIGAGRPLAYDSLLVQHAIDAGALRRHQPLTDTLRRLADEDRALHLIGLASDGQIHAHVEHLGELLAIAATHRVPRVWIHAITDGRDVADGTAPDYLRRIEEIAAEAGTGRIATVSGRGYALDKSGDLGLTRPVTEAIADGGGRRAESAAVAAARAPRGDVWVEPTVVERTVVEPTVVADGAVADRAVADRAVADGDAILFTNFRSDRIQQLADHLLDHLAATGRTVSALSLAVYDTRTPIPALVQRADASGGLADELERHGLRSVRIAEQEKFEHVTYYVNGRDERRRPTEEHVKVIGDGPPDYTARPEMNLDKVTDAVVAAAAREDVALVIANLANIDVVGHTGDAEATVRATEFTDHAVDRIRVAAQAAGRWLLLVGDHGNAELMARPGPDGGPRPYGGHTTNPVPLVVVPAPGAVLPEELPAGGTLADVAPTVLTLLGRPSGPAMTGRSLV
ncbi:2,3-bisphosphoglycerate-independent phosphoglycerate mutase [Streptomyces sp. NPDC015346]|uniref:2,3-bisphosphoglycerate-independent phosphoglycerate mutase n=1 Tax=Streptomyces sp. NPDC015346 TaxID=3364954 RepID=UPI0036FD59F2